MIRNKFLNKVRKKYQTGGGYLKKLRDPNITLGSKILSTSHSNRAAVGGSLSFPIMQNLTRGGGLTSLRGESQGFVRSGGREGIGAFESQLGAGHVNNPLPQYVNTEPKIANVGFGLRGSYNKPINRRGNTILKSNVGLGLGTGDYEGEYYKYNPNAFGDVEFNQGSSPGTTGAPLNPYLDANLSLSRQIGNKGSVGVTGSYGTTYAPDPGLRMGVTGSYGPLTSNVGYDATNNAVRAGVGLKFQKGGVKYNTMDKIQDSLTLGGLTPGVGLIPDAINTGISGVRALYNYATGDTARAKSQMGDLAMNAATIIPGAGQAAGLIKLGARTGKVVKGVKTGKKIKSASKLTESAVENKSGKVDIYPKPSSSIVLPTARNYANINTGSGAGPLASKLNTTAPTTFNFAPSIMQMGGMYDQPQMYKEGGEDNNTMPERFKVKKKKQQYYQKGGPLTDKVVQNYNKLGISQDILNQLNTTSSDTVLSVRNHPDLGASSQYLQQEAMFAGIPMEEKETQVYRGDQGYTRYSKFKKRSGGVALPGGKMQPIPGSDAVEFKGKSHEQGGIMVDSQTEVEGGETMDQVNMAKKGGKRDYFFSSFLKKGGRSFAQMHKDILRKGGDQEDINMLAKMQETAAGRNPKKVAKLGGVVEYKHGGIHKYEEGGVQKRYDEHEANKPIFNLTAPKPPRQRTNPNKIQELQYRKKLEKYEKELAEYNTAKQEYETRLSEFETIESQLSDEVEQEEMLREADEREAQEKADAEKAKKDAKMQEMKDLVKKARELNIELPTNEAGNVVISPNELKKLITKAEVTFEKQKGEEGVPEGQKPVKIGDKEFYLDEGSRLTNIATTLGDDFAETWFNKADPEILAEIGVNSFEDLLADGYNNSKIIEAYQNAWNAKNPNEKIQVDGDLGEQTLLTGWSDDELKVDTDDDITKITTPEITVTDKRTPTRLDTLPIQLLPVDDNEPELKTVTPPVFKDYPIKEELLTIPTIQPQLIPNEIDDNMRMVPPAEIPPYTPPTELDETNEYDYQGRIPWQGYAGMAAGLIPAAYAMFHKQPAAEQAGYTQGFRRPVIAQRGKAPKLARYDYNQDIANVGSEVRGMNKYIETSGGGPANMVNKMKAFSKGQDAKMKIRAAETRANVGVQNTEAQLEQQMTLDNMRRAQQASIFNAQMSRAETARMDQIDEANTQRRQKRIDDMEFMKYQGMSQLGQSLQQGFGDILDYKAYMAKAAAKGTGSGNVARDAQLIAAGYNYDSATGQWTKGDKTVKKFGGVKRLLNYKK